MPRSRNDSQLNLGPLEVRTSEGERPSFRKPEDAVDLAYATSAELFDAACIGAKLRNPEVAALLRVSESLVQKWRSKDARACPSHVQMLQLPLSFHLSLNRAMNERFGFGRAALRRLLDAAGDLAVVLEA